MSPGDLVKFSEWVRDLGFPARLLGHTQGEIIGDPVKIDSIFLIIGKVAQPMNTGDILNDKLGSKGDVWFCVCVKNDFTRFVKEA